MKKMRLYSLVIFLATVLLPCLGQTSGPNEQVNRVVITFSPLIINNINCSQNLYNLISELFNNPSESARKNLDASGDLWSVSSNYSGIQININTLNPVNELYTNAQNLIKKILDKKSLILAESNTNILPANRLYQFALENKNDYYCTEPVTIKIFNNDGKDITDNFVKKSEPSEILLSEDSTEYTFEQPIQPKAEEENTPAHEFCKLYEASNINNSLEPIIQNVEKPIICKILKWNGYSPDAFISASLIKNRIIFDTENPGNFQVEILFVNNSISLMVFKEIDTNELYSTHLAMEKKLEAAIQQPGPKEWESWSSKLLEVMCNDKREKNKNAMFDAWLKHWFNCEEVLIPEVSTFIPADIRKDAEIFSSEYEHNFYLAADTYPAIYACSQKSEDGDKGANVAVCLEGHNSMLDGISNLVSTSLQISIPIIITRNRPESLILSFYCPSEKIPAHLSKIKSSISEYLLSKHKIINLKNSIRLGIGGSSAIPAYQLHGLLTSGWPTSEARFTSKTASENDIYSLIGGSNDDVTASQHRWSNLISSSQARADLLSQLASRNLTITDWNSK